MVFYLLMVIEMYRNADSLYLRREGVTNIAYVALVAPVFVFPNALEKLL